MPIRKLDRAFLPCQKCGEPNKLTPAEYEAAVYCKDCVRAWEKAQDNTEGPAKCPTPPVKP